MEKSLLIGTGVLSWPRSERVSDRYGKVMLMDEGNNSIGGGNGKNGKLTPAKDLPEAGTQGRLMVRILKTRESIHIGDFARGLSPSTPAPMQEIVLGYGELFYETDADGWVYVGLKPGDGRASDWLNPVNLYRVHEQTVELYFISAEAE